MSNVPREPNEHIAPPAPGSSPELSGEVRNWAMACHLAGLALFVFPAYGNILGPLIVWLVKKNEHPFIDDQGKEALNFQISMSLYSLIGIATSCLFVGIPILLAVIVSMVVFAIIGAIKASSGETYRYPLTIRLIN